MQLSDVKPKKDEPEFGLFYPSQEERLQKAFENIREMGLDKLNDNFVCVGFRNWGDYVLVDKNTGLCFNLDTQEVDIFDFDDDMFYIAGLEWAFNEEQFDMRKAETDYSAWYLGYDPEYYNQVLEFYPTLPKRADVEKAVNSDIYKLQSFLITDADKNGYHTARVICTAKIGCVELKVAVSRKAQYILKTCNIFNESSMQTEYLKAGNKYAQEVELFADEQLFDEISNNTLIKLIQSSHFSFPWDAVLHTNKYFEDRAKKTA